MGTASGSSASSWTGTLVLGTDLIVYVGPGSSAERHAHDALQFVWSLGEPFRLFVGETEVVAKAAMVPSRVSHSFAAGGEDIIVMLVEPSGRRGSAVRQFAERHAGLDLSPLLGSVSVAPSSSDDPAEVLGWSDRVLAALVGRSSSATGEGDLRPEVEAAIRYVDAFTEGVPRLSGAAEHVGLSASRLTHLFSSQVGMPFRRYVLWARLRRAALEVRGGRDLTTAAAMAGFADSAHFSRVFRSLFGLRPSDVFPGLEVADAATSRVRTTW